MLIMFSQKRAVKGILTAEFIMVLPSSVKRFPLMWLWIAIVFLVSGMIINCVQLLLLPLWIINKDLFRWLNLNVVYLHWCRKYTIIYICTINARYRACLILLY